MDFRVKYLLIVFSGCITWQVYSQPVYYPFPSDNAYWSVTRFSPPDVCTTIHYGMNGDTILDGRIYSKIYENNEALGNEDTAFNAVTAHYYCGLREDSSKKIFVRRYSDTTELLLYDFSLNIGDTFCTDFFGGMICDAVVNVDSILIYNDFRRLIEMSPGGTQKWVEGVGNTSGLFQRSYIATFWDELICFKDEEIVKYETWNGCNCDNWNAIEEDLFTNNNIKVFPNPANECITIDLSVLPYFSYRVDLYSSLGNKIKTVISNNIAANMSIIDISDGIYILLITSGNYVTTGRFLKNSNLVK